MKKIKRFFFDICTNIWFGIKTSFLASKKYFLLKSLLLICTTIIPLATIWLWKEIINRIAEGGNVLKTTIAFISAYLVLKLVTYISRCFDLYINNRYSEALTFYIEEVMIDKTSRMDLAFFDSASMGDKVRRARNNFNVMNQTTWLVFNILSETINIVATFIIVCNYKWYLGIITLAMLIPYFICNKKHTEKLLRLEKAQIREKRIQDYYGNIFFDSNTQFEIKLYDIGNYFIEKSDEIWKRLHKINAKEEIRYSFSNTILSILTVFSEIITIIVSTIEVLTKKLGIGNLQYNINMVSRLRNQSSQLVNDVNRFLVNNTRLNELREFIALAPLIEKSGDKIPSKHPKIEFCNVDFKYPNSDKYVLKDCSFVIAPYEKIGLLGLNGAGKSTIIKLVLRFYDPLEGQILIDGIDIKEYDVYEVRKIFGVLFQEYVKYCLPIREIIALSDFKNRYDEDSLRRACEISGLDKVIADWKDGFDTVLGRFYADNGKDLSGGQWQLSGLARAYFKTDSGIMILDEPSAALDPISEDRIFNQLYSLCDGKGAITISHRLSNTTLSDRIFIIADGHIAEQGTHEELLQAGGEYARLFNLQASKYT